MYQLRDEESCLQRILQLLNRLYTSLYDPSPIIADKTSTTVPFLSALLLCIQLALDSSVKCRLYYDD
jgi:CHASE1-domain containing sensor protein